MTTREFELLSMLLDRGQAPAALGYSRTTLLKMVDAGVLRSVRPQGCRWYRFQKIQVAALVGLDMVVERAPEQMRGEPLLLAEKTVIHWTGYSRAALERIVRAGGLTRVKPAGNGTGRFRKWEVCRLVGLPA